MNRDKYGLGYPLAEIEGKGKEPMVSIRSNVLNGNFVKEGENFPFCGFPEPWYDKATQSMKPGFEIFHEHQFTEYKDPFLHVPASTAEKDWVNLLSDGKPIHAGW